jgi:hypothetical protein
LFFAEPQINFIKKRVEKGKKIMQDKGNAPRQRHQNCGAQESNVLRIAPREAGNAFNIRICK